MKLKKVLAVSLGSLALVAAGPGSASAGENTGTGVPTQGPAHAHSICAYSGLEDGDDNDDGIPELPHGPGVTPQNWGHAQQGARDHGATPADLKASGEHPGDSCNGRTGFLSGGR